MEAITPIKVNRNRNYLVVDCWLSWSRLDYRHHYDRRRQFPGQGWYAVAVKRKGRYSMLDEKDLRAIQSIIADAEQRITKNTVMMMETKFEKRFNLLAEGQSAILEKLKKAQ